MEQETHFVWCRRLEMIQDVLLKELNTDLYLRYDKFSVGGDLFDQN